MRRFRPAPPPAAGDNPWDQVMPWGEARRFVFATETEIEGTVAHALLMFGAARNARRQSKSHLRYGHTLGEKDDFGRSMIEAAYKCMHDAIATQSKGCSSMRNAVAWAAFMDRNWVTSGAAATRAPCFAPHTFCNAMENELAILGMSHP